MSLVASPLRRIASAVVPDAGKRQIDRVRRRFFLARIAGPTDAYLQRHDLEVLHGPFAGMRYLTGLRCAAGDLVAKLTGSYEAPLQRVAQEWIDAGFELVVDVGSAEGFYAVGFARELPASKILAFDIDPDAREQCARLAELNGVADRVQIRGACTPETLGDLPAAGVALLCDCEGYEKVLLDPGRAPVLRGWRILVELHDFIDPTITETIRERFAATHEIEMIASDEPQTLATELDFMTPRRRALIVSERPVRMFWAHLRPRA